MQVPSIKPIILQEDKEEMGKLSNNVKWLLEVK